MQPLSDLGLQFALARLAYIDLDTTLSLARSLLWATTQRLDGVGLEIELVVRLTPIEDIPHPSLMCGTYSGHFPFAFNSALALSQVGLSYSYNQAQSSLLNSEGFFASR